ncbi:MAG: hypothetical protein K0R51_1149 [Cytophagaceae bacterium]|jgi:hypothetical protein|nr:hypothetical protein [Cytophagaceae bacterium]
MCFIIQILFFSFLAFYAQAQLITTSQEDAIAVKNRILLLALPEEDKYMMSEKQDQTEYLRLYRNDLEGQRKAFQASVLKYWQFNDSIVVLSFKEAKNLMKKNPGKYAMLRYDDKTQDQIYIKTSDSIPVVSWSQTAGNYHYYNAARYDFRMLTVTSLVIELPKRVLQVFLPKLSPSTGDFIYAIRQMNYVLNNVSKTEGRTLKTVYKEMPQLIQELKTKTLLLDINEMNTKDGLRNLELVKKYYPYPVQLVNYNELENILKSGDTRYATVVHARYDFHNSTFCICNAGDGTLYNYFIGPTFDYGDDIDETKYTIMIYYPTINKLNLERYATGK